MTISPDPPSWIPSAAELDDLDLLLHGAYRPLTGFLDADAAASVTRHRTLPDGTPWPVPITLAVPDDVARAAAAAGTLRLDDEQRTPVAEITVTRTDLGPGAGYSTVAGPLRRLHPRERGDGLGVPAPAPAGPRPVLGVPFAEPPHAPDIAAVAALASTLDAAVVLLPLAGFRWPGRVDGAALVRTCVAARDELTALGHAAEVTPVPLPRHPVPEERDRALAGRVAAALGVTHVPDRWDAGPGGPATVAWPDMVLDERTGRWAPAADVPVTERSEPAAADVPDLVTGLVARGADVPRSLAPEITGHELRRAARPSGRGVAVMFTGLSGSGKSTIANAVHAALTGRTDRTVTLLDGDVVRTMLSSELGFSREHRELNVRRIGYVAAEVTRHGGVALCAPIAPYASVRAEVRRMVETHGRFVLVHVSTPLEVCEARDRKGLYAKARRGEIAEFTGISDPYEEPADAELTIDASRVDVAGAVELVLAEIG